MINLLGPVKRVTGLTRISFPTRTITSDKKKGKVMNVEVPTHIAGLLDFEAGAVGTIITSFDVFSHSLRRPYLAEIALTPFSLRRPFR
jgi:hypothetical protein